MGIKLIYIYIILAIVSCDATKKTINICNRKYTVYKHNSYLHEEDLNATFHTICFPNSRYSLFSYLVSGKRNDSNLVSTQLKYSGDTLIINTVYDKKVYHEEHDYISKRYYRCIPDGVVSLSNNNVEPDFIITIDTAKKYNMILPKKSNT